MERKEAEIVLHKICSSFLGEGYLDYHKYFKRGCDGNWWIRPDRGDFDVCVMSGGMLIYSKGRKELLSYYATKLCDINLNEIDMRTDFRSELMN